MKPIRICVFTLALLLWGCAPLKPGADVIEVRAEQSIGIAADTFDEFLKLEYENVDLVRAKALPVHQFAEYLREQIPVVINGQTNTYSRDIGIVLTATAVRKAYKANRSPTNQANLTAALATVEAALRQTQDNLASLGGMGLK